MGPRRRGDTSFSKRLRAKKSYVAGGLGFEPRQAESESAVLPLDDPPGSQTAEIVPRGPVQLSPLWDENKGGCGRALPCGPRAFPTLSKAGSGGGARGNPAGRRRGFPYYFHLAHASLSVS